MRSVDIFHDALDARLLDESDCLFVGGAGEFGIHDPLPEIEHFIRFLRVYFKFEKISKDCFFSFLRDLSNR